HDVGRATYLTATDDESLAAFRLCAELEGILPAIESAHALARLPEIVREVGKDGIVVLNLSGRGDKDVATVAAHLGRTI
ncbi:MAG: trpB, partial [Caulobacteraceae bacterium]|nr:trpB [Caulobacteraceae bacterium]